MGGTKLYQFVKNLILKINIMLQEINDAMVNRMGGFAGSRTVTGTGALTSQTNATSNLLTTLGISAVTLKAGELHVAPYGTRISAVTLTSGSIILY